MEPQPKLMDALKYLSRLGAKVRQRDQVADSLHLAAIFSSTLDTLSQLKSLQYFAVVCHLGIDKSRSR